MDISAATAALGGSIDSFALFALGPNDCNSTSGGCYNYTEFTYIDSYGGLIYTGDTAMATTNSAADNEVYTINSYLSNAFMGLNGEGSLGDADGYSFFSKYLSTSQTNLVFNQQVGGDGYFHLTVDSTNAQLLTGSIFIEGDSLQFNQVPIPATAWLFGSALAGLLVARRKNKK
ncbi:VPLPA-CTERM sorting domain-containing protein [bacterium]|nr:VPLPA-CTERM sorting domain-containing protein [bacterium]